MLCIYVPTNSQLDYATVVTFPGGLSEIVEQNKIIDPSYDWAFYAKVGYLFPCTGNDLTVGYTYLRSNEPKSAVVPSTGSDSISPILLVMPISTAGVSFSSVQTKATFNLNAVDLEGGQRFTTGAYDMRMFAGVRYANIDNELTTHSGAPVGLEFISSVDQEFSTHFKGVGPRIGVDSRYCLSSGFGLDASLSTALLLGTIDSRFDVQALAINQQNPIFSLGTKNSSQNRLVPNLDAKLGVDYTYTISTCNKSVLIVETGYQLTKYFNVIDRTGIVDTSGNGEVIYKNNTSNLAFDGPYLGVKYYA